MKYASFILNALLAVLLFAVSKENVITQRMAIHNQCATYNENGQFEWMGWKAEPIDPGIILPKRKP